MAERKLRQGAITSARKVMPWRALTMGALAAATFAVGWAVNGRRKECRADRGACSGRPGQRQPGAG